MGWDAVMVWGWDASTKQWICLLDREFLLRFAGYPNPGGMVFPEYETISNLVFVTNENAKASGYSHVIAQYYRLTNETGKWRWKLRAEFEPWYEVSGCH